MEGLVTSGLVKTIGVCNFSTQLLRQIFGICTIRPTTLQIEVHPQNSQEKLIRFAHEEGMKVTAFSAFGASSYVELNMSTEDDKLMNDPIIQRIAKEHEKTPAQILIRWALERNTFPLTKTSNQERMIENRNVLDFSLTKDDILAINGLNRNRRYNDPGVFCEMMGTYCPIYE